jgi:hypothetical protein
VCGVLGTPCRSTTLTTTLHQSINQNTKHTVRKRKEKSVLGVESDWIFEIGEPVVKFNPTKDLMSLSSSNPIFMRQDKPKLFHWRIRNLPHPLYQRSTFQIEVDEKDSRIVIRTTNKKYFKVIRIAEMTKLGLPLRKADLGWDHKNNTLLITYKKPQAVLESDGARKSEVRDMKSSWGI